MFLSHYQIIKEGEKDKFAVIDIGEFKKIKSLLNNTEKLQDYLDYLHIQEIKKKNEKKYTLQEAKKEIGLP